jgi:hypothetical protein
VAHELKVADLINQEIDKESQIIRGAIDKLFTPIHVIPQGQGPQGQPVRVVQGQGTNQRVSVSQGGVQTNSQRLPPNAIPVNNQQPRPSVGPQGQPQGFPRPSVGQGTGTNSQRIVQQQGGQGGAQMTSPRQGQPNQPQGQPTNPNQPRPSVGPQGQPLSHSGGPLSPRGPQNNPNQPQGQPVRVQQQGNPQQQQGLNTQQRAQQQQPPSGQPQGQQQGLNTLQRLMTNVQPGKGPQPGQPGGPQGGPKMQHPQPKLKPPQSYAEWKGVNTAAQREIVKATQFLLACDKRNVESMTLAIRKQKAVLLSLVESTRQCAALVKDEEEKKALLNNAKFVCNNVDAIFQELKQASCGFDVSQSMNAKLNNINDGIGMFRWKSVFFYYYFF